MLLRSGPIPTGRAWSFDVKWDGFRALVSTVDGLRVRSRRGWDMTPLLPELRSLPTGLVLDGEVVAFENGVPHFPYLTRRLLNGDRSVPVTFVAFDVLQAGRPRSDAQPASRAPDGAGVTRHQQRALHGPGHV
jgi:bifunctional non-homologous end joining protein LigD